MLKGKKILFTGLAKDKNDFSELIKNGADLTFFPTIKIIELELNKEQKQKINNTLNYDYLIFTSVNAVKFFRKKSKYNFNNQHQLQIVAIGEKTKKTAEEYGFNISMIPKKSSAESLVELLQKKTVKNKSVLIPGSKISNPKLRKMLLKNGADVDFIPVYNTIINNNITNKEIEKIKKTVFDAMVFTSPSGFKNFLQIMNIYNVKSFFEKIKIASIGPATTKEIEKRELKINIQPDNFNIKSLNSKIIKVFSNN